MRVYSSSFIIFHEAAIAVQTRWHGQQIRRVWVRQQQLRWNMIHSKLLLLSTISTCSVSVFGAHVNASGKTAKGPHIMNPEESTV